VTTTLLRVEITGRDTFWRDAVFVEWRHRYPDRKLKLETNGDCLIEKTWLEDLERVASHCYSTVVVAPTDPSRRSWFRQFLPFSFRSVMAFILVATTLLMFTAGTSRAKPKWQVLFDGKSTSAWRGFRRDTFPAKCWVIEEGSLKTVAPCDKSDQVDIITLDKYKDFELELEWRVAPGANSGIIYLVSEDEDQTWKTGPEMQVLDDNKHADGKIPNTSAGSLFALIAPANKTLRPVGQFNQSRVVVRNGHVEHWLNGKKVLEYELASDSLASLIAKSKFKAFPRFAHNTSGHVALQYHGDEVWFRNVRIRTKQ